MQFPETISMRSAALVPEVELTNINQAESFLGLILKKQRVTDDLPVKIHIGFAEDCHVRELFCDCCVHRHAKFLHRNTFVKSSPQDHENFFL